MAAEDLLTEEEQAEALKKWFRENWLWMIAGVVLSLIGILAWQRFQQYRADQGVSAAKLLDQYKAGQVSDEPKAASAIKQLDDSYTTTPYADEAHLLAAQHAVELGKFDQASSELRVVMEKARDPQKRLVARVRLARVLLQQNKADDALQLLDISKAGAFAGEMHEVRGDALLIKNDRSGARAEYQAALEEYKNIPGAATGLLQLKADELNNDSKPAATPVAAAK